MRALVVTLKINAVRPETEDRLEAIARELAAVEGLLATYWLRSSDRVMLVQSFDSHRAVNSYLDSATFAGLGRVPGARNVFVTHYDVSARLNSLSVLGALDEACELETEPALVAA
ncbi:hypothetical protein BH23CHL2_BH23CHL2_33130 [soil metagenome]